MNPQSHKIKVVHVITRFDKGGSAENTFLTVRGLDKNRYEVAPDQRALSSRVIQQIRKSGRHRPILTPFARITSG